MSLSVDDTLLSLSKAARLLPGPPHVSTLWRWSLRGIRGVRLETVLIGGRRFTTRDAVQRFAQQLTEATGPVANPSGEQRHEQDAAAVDAQLRKAGL